jgi:hypothetical protein
MRLKITYLPDEIINNLYTFGKEWMTTNNIEYIGLYHKYSTGETYTEGVWDSKKSIELIPYEDTTATKFQYKNLKSINTKFITPTQYQAENSISINQEQIQRYFLQRKNDLSNIIEIDSNQFDLYNNKQIDTNLYTAVRLIWYISGNVDDVIINNSKKLGVVSKNRNAVHNAEQRMPGISKKLSNLLEFYTDTDFVVPRDINLG